MIYKKLLVPLDGSPVSETILPYARSFAKSLKVPVELLHVIDPNVFKLLESTPTQRDEAEAETRKSSVAYLQGRAETFSSIPDCECLVMVGDPAKVIIDRATNSGAMIAMASHGRSGPQRWLLGSVAHKVASAASNPLLLVRATERTQTEGDADLKSVFVPLDGSKLAETALPHAAELAKELLIELIVLRVYDLSEHRRYLPRPRVNQIAEELKREAKDYVESIIRRLEAQGLEELSYQLLEGNPAVEILGIAQRTPNSLVAITTRGRTGSKRWLLGSVTEHVTGHARGPILIIRAPLETELSE